MSKGSIGDAIAKTLGDGPDVSTVDTRVQLIPLSKLHENPLNFYPSPGFDELMELANSIAANGLLEPLTVTQDGERYRIISGHSRWRALKLPFMATKRRDLIDGVPCVVLPAMSEPEELSYVIEANRQRVKNSAVLALEAERLTEAYRARKNAGEDLPGRIRDRVAESLKISASKLAMAEATKKNLTLPGFKAQWESGEIPDTVAYEISKLQGDHQYRLLDWCINNDRQAGSLKVAEVKKLEEQFNARSRKWDMPREREDKLFLEAAEKVLAKHLRIDPTVCGSRAVGIEELKRNNSHAGGSGPEWACDCDSKGVTVRNGKPGAAPRIMRSWAEAYDALCLVALRRYLAKG